MESERISISNNNGVTSSEVCPRCYAKTFYDITPQIAWCWASGLIEFGTSLPEGAIKIAEGPRSNLKAVVGALTRHGRGSSDGKFLVPGVPEASSQELAADALDTFLKWVSGGNGHRGRYGVVFMKGSECAEMKLRVTKTGAAL